MGFYIRKSFRAGPVRINLSKKGIGTSIGVKGFRVGTSADGRSYVHAGRGGLYYRENLSTKKCSRAQANKGSGSRLIIFILIIVALYIFSNIIRWINDNPTIAIVFGLAAIAVSIVVIVKKYQKNNLLSKYKDSIDNSFILNRIEYNANDLKRLRENVARYNGSEARLKEIEQSVYVAILDKIIDDKVITNEEKQTIQNAEQIFHLNEDFIEKTKKEIFHLSYFDAIADHVITDNELERLNNLIAGLGLDKSIVSDEIKLIYKIRKVQALSLPLKPIENVGIKIQRNETAYFEDRGQILSRKKAKKGSSIEYEYSIKRDGKLVITDKRVLVVGEGTSNIKISDILDVDVDLDHSTVIISKNTSQTPTILRTSEPLYAAKILDLLAS